MQVSLAEPGVGRERTSRRESGTLTASIHSSSRSGKRRAPTGGGMTRVLTQLELPVK
jgi:hypothetical protein